MFLKPPFDRAIGDWIEHVCVQYETGNVDEALVLVPSHTDTEWFERLSGFPRCFMRGRLHFSNHESAAPFPSMMVYLGEDPKRFIAAFSDRGGIYEGVR